MGKAIFFIFLFVPALTVQSQDHIQDNLFLKNGSVIKGSIIKHVLNESVTIVDSGGDTLNYGYNEIEKLTSEVISGKIRNSTLVKPAFPRYQLITEGAACLGINMYSPDYMKINLINGIRLNRLFYLGVGLGIRYNINTELENLSPDYTHLMFPVFTDFRAYISLNKNMSTYISLGFGCTLVPDQITVWNPMETTKIDYSRLKNKGVLFNSSAGISFRKSEKRMLHVGIVFELQDGIFNYYFASGKHDMFYTVDKFAASLGVTAGITF
jgi:hypothetical protein